MASVSFALNNRQWAALEERRHGDESLNLAAKRLFLGVLDAPEPTETDRLDGEISDLKERLKLGCARFDKLEERLDSLPDLSKISYLQTVLEHLVKRCEEQLNSPPPIAIWESRLGEIEQKFAHISPPVLESPPVSPSRLPKATRRQAITTEQTP